MFKVIKKSKISKARLGSIETKKGRLSTPLFMPDATRGAVKHLSADELTALDLSALVANTLHLFLRPGMKLIKRAGSLHNFMNWQRPILTDSGGYQVYSLIHKHKNGDGGKITDQGAIFRSPLDGAKLKLTPEQSIRIQLDLGSELMVCLDDCPPNSCSATNLAAAVARTIKWAKRCSLEFHKQVKQRGLKKRPLLIAVIQGGNNLALRRDCAAALEAIGFDGYGFGARHIDEEGNFSAAALKSTAEVIPENKLRFGLGIGLPEDIVRSVKMGWDMFDCVIPTREGRHGKLFFQTRALNGQSHNFYKTVNITNSKFAKNFSPINPESARPELKAYSKSYLRYLFRVNEPLAARLASLNNLEFYVKILSEIRDLIRQGKF